MKPGNEISAAQIRERIYVLTDALSAARLGFPQLQERDARKALADASQGAPESAARRAQIAELEDLIAGMKALAATAEREELQRELLSLYAQRDAANERGGEIRDSAMRARPMAANLNGALVPNQPHEGLTEWRAWEAHIAECQRLSSRIAELERALKDGSGV